MAGKLDFFPPEKSHNNGSQRISNLGIFNYISYRFKVNFKKVIKWLILSLGKTYHPYLICKRMLETSVAMVLSFKF